MYDTSQVEVLVISCDGNHPKRSQRVRLFTSCIDTQWTPQVHWDMVKDMFHVSTPISFSSGSPTKRTITSDAAKVYDVMGRYAPILFRIKSLMQKLWMMKLGWDPQQLSDEWTKWRQELSALTDHSIPRRLFSQDINLGSLYNFTGSQMPPWMGMVVLCTFALYMLTLLLLKLL